jgi:hypothetical protein
MPSQPKKVFLIVAGALFILAVGGSLFLFRSGKNGDGGENPASSRRQTSGFSFLDLDGNTRLTESIRNELTESLGSDAITRRGTLNLADNFDGLLETHFRDLDKLNQRLNYSPRERIEHEITRLVYRYPNRKRLPFNFVELLFANDTKLPLVFRIVAHQDGAPIIETLKERYGSPDVIRWGEEKNKALYWRKDGNLLLASATRDQRGDPEYHIAFFFSGNITALVGAEEKVRRERLREKEQAGKRVF